MSSSAWLAWTIKRARAGPGFFPPEVVVHVKSLACELPTTVGAPLARWTCSDLATRVRQSGVVAAISDSTVWRWLNADAIRPWQHRCWIFPRDPQFVTKAGRVLDLYHRRWDGEPLTDSDFVISADEKTSIKARKRIHPTQPPQPGRAIRVEHEYERCGAWAYLAALDVHRAKLFGRCEAHSGIAAFDRLVDDVMTQPPYRDAHRVFWIVDNGSSHRGQRAVLRLQARYPHLILVHGPVHASWLNQIEIYFSVIQRKVLTPNDFPSLDVLAQRLAAFAQYYEQIATPFQWTFSRHDLERLMQKFQDVRRIHALAA